MIFTCAADEFKKTSEKCDFLKLQKKPCRLKKIKCLMFFKVARPVCSRLHFDLRKHFTQKQFILKNVVCFVFCIFYQTKNEEVKYFFSKTPPNCCPYRCTNLGKKISSISSAHCQKTEIENVRL